MTDVPCPYCQINQEINHDDGYGYEEGEFFEQTCEDCEKTFMFSTLVSFHYEAKQADCLNGGEHIYKATCTYPKEYTKMRCKLCGIGRLPTKEEFAMIMQLTKEDRGRTPSQDLSQEV